MSKQLFKLLKSFKYRLFKDITVDEAFRYLAVVDQIKQQKIELGRVLEIGSGDFGITPYLRGADITGLDQSFSSRASSLKQMIGSAVNLPFGDHVFDTVLTVDCLEHIPQYLHSQVFAEIFRVAKRQVIISLPCGSGAYDLDWELNNYFLKKFGRQDVFLQEHVENGPISEQDIVSQIRQGAAVNQRSVKIDSWPIMNLSWRRFYMKVGFQSSIIGRVAYYLLLVLLPFRKLFNFRSCYWQLFIVDSNS